MVHLSTELPTELHLVEIRRPHADGTTSPDADDFERRHAAPRRRRHPAGARADARSVRLWVATLALPVPLLEHLDRWGRPIRYRYVPDSWPIARLHERLRPRARIGRDALGRPGR